jgi:hypothetical protein
MSVEHWCNDSDRENRRTWRKTCTSPNLYSTYATHRTYDWTQVLRCTGDSQKPSRQLGSRASFRCLEIVSRDTVFKSEVRANPGFSHIIRKYMTRVLTPNKNSAEAWTAVLGQTAMRGRVKLFWTEKPTAVFDAASKYGELWTAMYVSEWSMICFQGTFALQRTVYVLQRLWKKMHTSHTLNTDILNLIICSLVYVDSHFYLFLHFLAFLFL